MALASALRRPTGGAAYTAPKKPRKPKVTTMKGFKPFEAPEHPPQGTYDPTLDASVRAAKRGLQDYEQDYERDYGRREDDYLLARGDVEQTHDRSLSDLLRNYETLRMNQRMAGNASGLMGTGDVVGGGFLAQAREKRVGNRTRDTGRLEEDTSRQYSRLALGHTRTAEDASTALERAKREFGAFQSDTSAAEYYQAAGTGYTPPTRPSWEKVIGKQHYKELGSGRYLLPDGRVVGLSELKRLSRKPKKPTTTPVPVSSGTGGAIGPPA